MKKYFFLFISLISLSIFSCQKKVAKNTESQTSNSNAIKNIIIEPAIDITNTGAVYNIDSLSIKGDILSAFVNYSGGCKDHVFELYSSGMYNKSMPPQMMLCLKHTNNEDACRMMVMQEYKFNIAGIKHSDYETIVLRINDKIIYYNKN